jgi:hypothetical protein
MADARPNNKRLTIMLAVGGVAIALFAAYSLLSGGDGGDDPAVAPASTQTADIGGTPTTPSTTAPGAPEIPSGEFDVFATRNPFEPAIQITDTSSDVPESVPTDGGSSPSPDPAPVPTDPTTPASPDPSGGTAVAVIDVYDEAGATLAVVQVGSTQYTVAAGQVFATSYKVVSLSGTCGQFMYGDSPFSLCEGEEVIK